MTTYYQVVIYIMTGIVGLCVGSFLNVVIYRLPRKMNLAYPPSHCTVCDYTLRWYDNIPILSYLFLGGKCRKCRNHISFRYTLVEMMNTVLWLLCLHRFGFSSAAEAICSAVSAIACSICICIAFIDIEQKVIFDRFQIIMLVLGAIFTAFDTEISIFSHIIGAFAGGIIFYLVGFFVGKLAKREALGGGDIKFAFVCGLFLGWGKLTLMVLIASVSACIVIAAANIKKKQDTEREIPFAPFLTFGFATAQIFGTQITDAYLHLLGLE